MPVDRHGFHPGLELHHPARTPRNAHTNPEAGDTPTEDLNYLFSIARVPRDAVDVAIAETGKGALRAGGNCRRT